MRKKRKGGRVIKREGGMREEERKERKGQVLQNLQWQQILTYFKTKSLLDNSSTNHISLLHHGNCEALDPCTEPTVSSQGEWAWQKQKAAKLSASLIPRPHSRGEGLVTSG